MYASSIFQGRATPQWNPKATASFTNVTLSTTRGDMARALLEGIAYEIRNNLDIVEGQIGKVEQIQIGGGLSNSMNLIRFRQMSMEENWSSISIGKQESLEHGQAQWWKVGKYQIIRKL